MHALLKANRKTQASSPKEDIVRLRSSKTFNRYKTVESPAPSRSKTAQSDQEPASSVSPASSVENKGHPALPRTRIPRHRPRYSFKMRARKKEHAPPARMKQFIWKPPKEPPKAADDTDDNTRAKPKTGRSRTPSTSRSKSVDDMDKNQLVRSMVWEHPPAVLDVGTLAGNVKRVLSSEPNLQEEVVDTIQEASRLAADTKRKAQRLIGKYLETLRLEDVSEMDREILDNLCERVKPKETSSNGSDEEADNVESEDASTELDGKGST
ncbi:hypothetical protein BGX33_003246, partial [Mortierella sp. NVP41]